MHKYISIKDNKEHVQETGNIDEIYKLHFLTNSKEEVNLFHQNNQPFFLGDDSIRNYYNCSTVIFKDLETINTLKFHVKGDNKVSISKKSLKEYPYKSYDFKRKEEDIHLGTKTLTYKSTKNMHYTFGVEIDTSGGCLPAAIPYSEKLNLECVRDGSISGGEYVTGVLKGDAGFIQLHKVLSLLRESTKIDKTCGVHVHIGNLDFNKSFTVFSYILGVRLEKEIFDTLPKSRHNNRYCDFLNKLPVPSIDDFYNIFKKYGYEPAIDVIYDILYEKMSYGESPSSGNNKLTPHKFGRYCGQYNGIEMEHNFRYKWLNLIPANFNMKKANSLEEAKKRNTIEFRSHSASLSYIKIRNWVLFCMSFVNYVENNKVAILDFKNPISMKDILIAGLGNIQGNKLNDYFTERKKMFNPEISDASEKKEYNEKEETLTNLKTIVCV